MSQTEERKPDLRTVLKQAWEESCSRPEVDEAEKARDEELDEKFNNELLQLLEEKHGKSFVANQRTYIVEGIEYQLSGKKIYIQIEGMGAFAHRKSLFALKNKEGAIHDEERGKVVKLNQQLQGEYPKKTPRYSAIAEQLDISAGRVRYIIEGPRRNK